MPTVINKGEQSTMNKEYSPPTQVRMSESAQRLFELINEHTQHLRGDSENIKTQNVINSALSLYLEYLKVVEADGAFCAKMPDGETRQYIMPAVL